MDGAATEILVTRIGKDGKARQRARPFGSICQHQMYPLMAAFKPKMPKQWHLEQWFRGAGLWLTPEPQYERQVRKNLARALVFAQGNPDLFRLVFRDEYTGEERVVDPHSAEMINSEEILLPQGGPFIVRPIESVKRKKQVTGNRKVTGNRPKEIPLNAMKGAYNAAKAHIA